MAFAALFFAGAFRNVAAAVQPVSDLNNHLLPLWMIILGVVDSRRVAGPGSPGEDAGAARSSNV